MAGRKDKEENYFDMFVTSVNYSCEIAEKLLDLVKNYESYYTTLEKVVDDLHSIEHSADIHFHKMFSQLSASFITPIEREDILELSQSIDTLTDAIEEIGYALYVLDIKKLRADVVPFCELIVSSCNCLKIAITEFKKFKKSHILTEQILDVNNVEEEGDRFYRKAVRELFTTNMEAIEVIRWREIYDGLENCLDACSDVADNVEGIVLKNS